MNNTAKRFYRSRTNKIFGGIGGAIAQRWNISAWFIRICFLCLQFFAFPFTFLIYIFAVFVIPLEPEEDLDVFQEDIRYSSYSRKRKIVDLENEFRDIERKVRRLEDYISSGEYELNEEMGKL
jgi:phage shock protein C